MGKFFRGKIQRDRTSLIKYAIMAIAALVILILFIAVLVKSRKPKTEITLLDNLRFEVNSGTPDVNDILDVKNYDARKIKIDYGDFDITKVGRYNVKISSDKMDTKTVQLEVYDETPPTLKLKSVTMAVGEELSIDKFIESCEDNSKEECQYEYASGLTDANGNVLDYRDYVQDGSYTVKIIAKDPSGNATKPQEANLIIGQGAPQDGSTCQYGNLIISPSRLKYPLAVVVGDQNTNCAVDKNLWNNSSVQAPVNDFYNKDIQNLKPDLESKIKSEFPNGASIKAYPHYIALLNDSLSGLVGYAVYVKIYVAPQNESNVEQDKYLVAAYYLNSDGTRKYENNKYNLK